MDDLSPEAILGIAAACVAGLVGLGALVVRFACPRVFAAHFGLPAPKVRRQTAKVPVLPVVSHNPMLVVTTQNPIAMRTKSRALPREVDIDSFLKVQRLKREFKPSSVSNARTNGNRDPPPAPPLAP